MPGAWRVGHPLPVRLWTPAGQRAHGILLHVMHRAVKVFLVECAGMPASLPQVATAPVERVDVLTVTRRSAPDGVRVGILSSRNANDLDMIHCLAIALNAKPIPLGVVL